MEREREYERSAKMKNRKTAEHERVPRERESLIAPTSQFDGK